jgi:plasmid stabilization system protein ParE
LKTVRYSTGARDDLRAIADYYGGIDPDVADRMLADIERAIGYLREFPHLAQAVHGRPLRGKLTRRYRFKVIYSINGDAIEIVGIFRFQNRDV